MSTRVLIVEDDLELREAIADTLELAGFDFLQVGDGEQAVALLEQEPVDIVVTDVNMPGMDGHQLLAHLNQAFPGLPVVLMTAFGQVQKAVDAIRNGAVDYLMKPFDADTLIDTLRRFSVGSSTGESADEPIAEEMSSRQLLQLAARVAQTDSTVLITGESGTGKEVLAQYIHNQSERCKKTFVAFNCAAIPENMLEAILFGHEKGAFTGAHAANPGKFEQANGGTLLLDEVTEMDLSLQAKLLRVLQEQEVERVGGRQTIKLDVRVLATTNRQLEQYVAEGKFREDLYYRLNVFPLQWLPLRERPADIVPLAERLLQKHAAKMRRPGVELSPEAQESLRCHRWPGNVRELDNIVQRALILQPGPCITPADLHLDPGAIPVEQAESVVSVPALSSAELEEAGSQLGAGMRQHEFQLIVEALRSSNGSRKDAADQLGISPRTLRYKLARIRESGVDLDSLLRK